MCVCGWQSKTKRRNAVGRYITTTQFNVHCTNKEFFNPQTISEGASGSTRCMQDGGGKKYPAVYTSSMKRKPVKGYTKDVLCQKKK